MRSGIRIFFLTALLAMPTLVLAHKVNMFAYPEGEEIFVEGYFTDGIKPMGADVAVYDSSGAELLRGKTNDEGQFQFAIPKNDDLRIVMNTGEGHQTEYVVSGDEIAGSAGNDDQAGPSIMDSNPAAESPVSNAEVRKAVGEAIRPVMRSISELKEQRTFSDIVGGIGFIFGVIGVFFYIKARQMSGK